MAETLYRGNLSASRLSYVSTFQGRTVIVGGIDQNYVRGLNVGEDGLVDDASRGVPQIQYMHNVMPTHEGFQSVTYFQRAATIGAVNCKEIYSAKEHGLYFTFDEPAGTLYYALQGVGATWTWNLGTVGAPAADTTALTSITSAMVNGVTYYLLNTNIFYAIANPCRTIDGFGNFNVAALIGTGAIFPGRIRGNASCFGYHILWDENIIAWSSLLNPLDFVPSLVTGAGFAAVEGARGDIVAVIPHQLGMIVYTKANAVAMLYTGNARYPFRFQEIVGVGGIAEFDPATSGTADPMISDDPNTNSQFAYTSSGLQQVGISAIKTVYPDITDFLSGNYFEDFNTTTRLFTRTKLTQPMVRRVQVVADRYLVLSYGISTFTHALVMDIVSKRIGKLKITHVACFTMNQQFGDFLNTARVMGPKGSLAFLTSTGQIVTVDFDTVGTGAFLQDSCMMFGKFQEMRGRMIQMQGVELENAQTTGYCQAYLYTSLDGKNWTSDDTVVAPTALQQRTIAANLRTWYAHVTGYNHSIMFIGTIYATTLILKFNKAGKPRN